MKKFAMGWSIPIALILGWFMLSHVWWRIQSIRLGYQIENKKNSLKEKRDDLLNIEKQISLHRSIARLDKVARRKFQLRTPEMNQIIYIIERASDR